MDMNNTIYKKENSSLVADWKSLQRIFIRPEDDECRETLVKYMEQILFGLHDFLKCNVGITEEISLKNLSRDFKDTIINENPEKKLADVISDIINRIAPRAVNVASPYFIGHMTAAIPFFMVHLKAIASALNQNVVKLETSKVLSVLERQVIAKIHRLVFKRPEEFYQMHVQSIDTTLGNFTSGGTTANLTAMWVARNRFFSSNNKNTDNLCINNKNFQSIEENGITAALHACSLERAVILVSERAHFSLKKAGGILGIGNKNVIPIDVDKQQKMDIKKLHQTIKNLNKRGKTGIIAIVGIAGATETGTIDPLCEIADLCREYSIHFHVDAAWGGPVLLSEKYSPLLKGIEMADSVTIDGHKQFYLPMTSGMIYFKDPNAMDCISYHSNYVNRTGSVDLGIKSLEGSREANSMILDSALKIMGSRGYALMIDHGIETAKKFAREISNRGLFELITKPELNILTYRLIPKCLKEKLINAGRIEKSKIDRVIDEINIAIQRQQREAGKSFVSRTRIKANPRDDHEIVVLRSVIMNPMTDLKILKEILDEQEQIFATLSDS